MIKGLPYATVFSGGGGGLPPIPTREELGTIKSHGMQGITLSSGRVVWEVVVTSPDMYDEERHDLYAQKVKLGDTHIVMALSWRYPATGVEGRDLTYDLPWMKSYVREALEHGMRGVLLMIGGDGMDYDPHGWTYGWSWLMANFQRIYDAMGPTVEDTADLRPYIAWCPGFDGVVPGWQPPRCVDDFLLMARPIVGNGVLALELSAGYCVWAGDEVNNYPTPAGQALDVILQEFPTDIGPPQLIPNYLLGPNGWAENTTNEQRARWDQCWQIVGRLVSPYYRPADQPANDDPGGAPYLLGVGTPRGPFFYCLFEYDTYEVVNGSRTQAEVQIHREALAALGRNLNVG